MPDIRVVLVGAKFEGNVGAIARSMANFDFDDLCLVRPCELGDDAYRRAKHGSYILDEAKIFDTLEDAVNGCFLIAGTSGSITRGETNYARIPISPKKFADDIKDYEEKVAIVFGREDMGLYQEDLDKCDVFINIPTNDDHPILNLSHAATIVMYELFGTDNITHPEPADNHEKELLFKFFEDLLKAVDYPDVRRERTALMFRKMMGRSIPTKCEYHTIMGVLGGAVRKVNASKK